MTTLEQLSEDLGAVAFVTGTDASAEFQEVLDRARRLLDVKLRFEVGRGDAAPPLVVIAGGTNVGKSTVFNWVVGEAVASSSPLARHTKAPTIYVHTDELPALRNGAFLPMYRRMTLESPQDPAREGGDATAYFLLSHGRDDVRGVVLVDSPDIDSTHARNRSVAEDLLFLADAVLFVATPEKYNDELCVQYLRQASQLDKALICVLNKGADEEVARDFREVVVPELSGEALVLTLPYVTPKPDPATSDAYRGRLHDAVLAPADGGAALRQRAIRGARVRLGRDLDRLLGRLREELSELDRIRSEVDLVLDARRDEYVRFLNGLAFYELDQVFERVMQYFRIPVLDNVYDGFRSAVGFVSQNVTRLVSGRAQDDSRSSKLRARDEATRQKVKELTEVAWAEALDLPYRHAGVLRDAVPVWVEGLAGRDVEAVNAQVEAFQLEARGEAERWIEGETRKHVELLEQHPYARAALRTVKGVFQVGFGLLSAKLTGGFGPWDLLIGGATERATKAILESVGGYVHYQTLKLEFCRDQGALFRTMLEQRVKQPLMARLPTGIDPERLERLSVAAVQLRRGEQP